MIQLFDTATLLKSTDGSAELSYYKEGGGYINHLVLSKDGKQLNVLAAYQTLDDVVNNFSYRSTVLFPFPNRLRDGQYRFDGKEYQFPINEKHRGNNLHGFLKEYTPEIEVSSEPGQQATLKTRYLYDGARDYYPFPADIIAEYRFVSAAELQVTFSIINSGKTSMPVGTGWHPYYDIGDKIDDLEMQFPECNRVLIDERMIPTGASPRYQQFDKWTKIGATVLDDCFIPLKGGLEEVAVKLWSDKAGAGVELWQDQHYGFIQVYTSPDRQSIAIEPMSCNINAFQTHDGLSVLAPGESFSGKFGVRMITAK